MNKYKSEFINSKAIVILFIMISFLFVDFSLKLFLELKVLTVHCIVYSIILFSRIKFNIKTFILHVYTVLLIFSFIVIQGGITSPITFFLLDPIISSFVIYGFKIGIAMTLSVSFCLVIVFITNMFFNVPFPILDNSQPDVIILTFIAFIGVMIDMIITILKYEEVKNRFISDINYKNETINLQQKKIEVQQQEMIDSTKKQLDIEKVQKDKLQTEKEKLDLQLKLSDIETSIQYASEIQRNLLTDDKELSDFFSEYYIYYKPKDIVGGDYYYVHTYNSTKIVILIDTFNLGLTGMLLGNLIISYLDSLSIFPEYPSILLYDIDMYIKGNFKEKEILKGCNISIVYIKDDTLSYIGANGFTFIVNESEVKSLPSFSNSIGTKQEMNYVHYKDAEYKIGKDDVIVVASDGLFKYNDNSKENKKDFMISITDFAMKYSNDWKLSINNYVSKHIRNEQNDDITILCFNSI